MIKFENVTKKFPLGNLALDEVSFDVEDKEFIFLVGPSGAGKTTILKLIMRESVPSEGTILVDDFDITSNEFTQVEILRRKIGMIFQDFKILFDKNAQERVKAHNRRAGYREFDENISDLGTLGQLYTFDIVDGDAIIRVLMR